MAICRLPLYVGVDPGKEGYITAWDTVRIQLCVSVPWAGSDPDIDRLIQVFKLLKRKGARNPVVEHQQPFAKEGPVGAFTAGGGYWALRTAIRGAGFEPIVVRPATWKRGMGIPAVGTDSMPALPKRPKKHELGATKTTRKRKLAEWKRACKPIERERARLRRRSQVERKRLACELAIELQPEFDFRETPTKRTPHSGKCESFLMSVYGYRLETGEVE